MAYVLHVYNKGCKLIHKDKHTGCVSIKDFSLIYKRVQYARSWS